MRPEEVVSLVPEPLPGHEDCEPAWCCGTCGQPVCPRCFPSPGEFEKCADCWWFSHGGDAA